VYRARLDILPRPKNKIRSSLEKILASYKRKGATQEQKKRPNKTNHTKPSPGHREEPDSRSRHVNHTSAPYLFGELVDPWVLSSQTPIVAKNNLVKNMLTNDEGIENTKAQYNKYLLPRWCPSSLSHTQKKKITTDVQERISGAKSRDCASKISDYEEGIADEASCFIINLN
jgi:hypothetical protein